MLDLSTVTTTTTTTTTLDTDALMLLRTTLHGDLILPDTFAYDAARAVWNGIVDACPDLIVRCHDAHDVAVAVTFARMQGLSLAVRSGGHSIAGHSTGNGMVD